MGRHPTGHRVYYTKAYKELEAQYDKLSPEDLKTGDQFIYIGYEKTELGVYKVLNDSNESRIHCARLTPTGRLAKRGKMFLYKNRYSSKVFKVRKNAHDYVKRMHEQSKIKYTTKETGRDYQRQKVYDAENRIRKAMKESIPVLTKRVADVYVDEVYAKYHTESWWTKNRRIELRQNCRRRGAVAFGWGLIEYGNEEFGLNKMILIHEIAHVANDCPNSHGAEFCGVYLALLSNEMPDVYRALKAQYDKNNIDYEVYV